MFEGLKEDLKTLRSIIEDVIKLGKEAFSLKRLYCYAFDPVRKKCSLSVLLAGTIKLGFGEKKFIQKLSEWWCGESPITTSFSSFLPSILFHWLNNVLSTNNL